MPDQLSVSIWGAIAGGLISILVYFVSPTIKRFYLTKRLKIRPLEPHGILSRCRVCNDSYWTIEKVKAFLSLNFRKTDVLPPPDKENAFITPDTYIQIDEDQLCWSVRYPTINPPEVDIFANEGQDLGIFRLTDNMIIIPSEDGWPNKKRVFLKSQKYAGKLKIVSKDTNARCFRIYIDPSNRKNPLTIISQQ